MSTFVVAGHPAHGHLNPLLAIGQELRRRGHGVVFTTSAPRHAPPSIAAAGFRFAAVRPSLRLLPALLIPYLSGFRETCFAMRAFCGGMRHYANAIGGVIDELHPDALISDFTFPGAWLAAESRELPYAAVYHIGLGFRGEGIPPFASGLPINEDWHGASDWYRRRLDRIERSLANAVRRTRRHLGVTDGGPAESVLSTPASPWLNLVLSAEACEAPRYPLPDTTFFVGPCIATSAGPEFPFEQLRPDRPKVYVSLGTVFNNKPRVFQKIVAAFADGRHQLIVSAGRACARLRASSLPADTIVAESVPQVALLPRVDVVISHGGNNTVNETLAAGRPLLVMPVGGEQGDNAARVVYLRAGLRADLQRSSAAEIRAKVDRLLDEPTFRERAAEIAQALAQTDGAATASNLIERLVATRAPVRRPAGYPLTLTRDLPAPWEWDRRG